MILVLACDCGSATPLARRVLQDGGVADWLTIPIHKGKEHSLHMLETLPQPLHTLLAYRALADHIASASSFTVIVGYDDETFYWSDVHTNAPIEVMEAHAILKRFA